MNEKKIEKIFQNSACRNELFDAFGDAIKSGIRNTELYKILLANPALSTDELEMYSQELVKKLKGSEYDFYLWTGQIFEMGSGRESEHAKAFDYYCKASLINPTDAEPLIKILRLYNYDYQYAINNSIEEIVEKRVRFVNKKSVIYSLLADHFKAKGDTLKFTEYKTLSELSASRE
ncbi:hypothetical protein APF79_03290 [bacterium BRH_c32]|nr:MAG: hypothetical protein APF79_03290 [bacterium BRH_c32]